MFDRIFNRPKIEQDKAEKNKETLSDIVRGVQYAINSATDAISQHYVKYLDTFFEEQEDGQFKAKTLNLTLDDDHKMEVPVISLTPQSGLHLKKLKMKMGLEISESQVKEINDEGHKRSKFKVQMASNDTSVKRKGKIVDIEMEFEAEDPPEGVMKVLDYYTNTIRPQEKTKE